MKGSSDVSENSPSDRFISDKVVDVMTFLSRGTRWRMSKAGEFPPKYQISPGKFAYRESEILEWMATRPVTKSKPPKNRFEQKNVARGNAAIGGGLVSAVGG